MSLPSEIPHGPTALIDITVLERLKTLGGSVAHAGEDVVAELLRLYRRDSSNVLTALVDALALANDNGQRHRQLSERAHALKGASLAVGATRVAELSRQLEKACKDDDAEKCTTLVKVLERDLDATWAALDMFALDRRAERDE